MSSAGGGSYSCDFPMSAPGGRHCTDQVWTGSANKDEYAENACKSFGGMRVASCDRTGALGGCRTMDASAGGTLTTTTWLFIGTTDSVKMACASILKGTFVAP